MLLLPATKRNEHTLFTYTQKGITRKRIIITFKGLLPKFSKNL